MLLALPYSWALGRAESESVQQASEGGKAKGNLRQSATNGLGVFYGSALQPDKIPCFLEKKKRHLKRHYAPPSPTFHQPIKLIQQRPHRLH